MTTQLTIADSSIQSGSATVATYMRGGKNISPQPVEEYVLIQTGSIQSGQFKLINFTMFDYEVKFCSIWTLNPNNPDRGGVTIAIVEKDAPEVNLHEFEIELPFLCNIEGYALKIAPDVNVKNTLIFCKQVHRIDTINLLG
jgi:hypothetical protein